LLLLLSSLSTTLYILALFRELCISLLYETEACYGHELVSFCSAWGRELIVNISDGDLRWTCELRTCVVILLLARALT
jgi:hypothetical protein